MGKDHQSRFRKQDLFLQRREQSFKDGLVQGRSLYNAIQAISVKTAYLIPLLLKMAKFLFKPKKAAPSTPIALHSQDGRWECKETKEPPRVATVSAVQKLIGSIVSHKAIRR